MLQSGGAAKSRICVASTSCALALPYTPVLTFVTVLFVSEPRLLFWTMRLLSECNRHKLWSLLGTRSKSESKETYLRRFTVVRQRTKRKLAQLDQATDAALDRQAPLSAYSCLAAMALLRRPRCCREGNAIKLS